MLESAHQYCVWYMHYTGRMQTPILHTARCILRLPGPEDAKAMLDYMVRNDARFAPTDPPRPQDFHTLGYFEKYGRDAHTQCIAQTAFRFTMHLQEDPAPVAGWINFTQVLHGPFRSCGLGYSVDSAQEGKGLMHEAVGAALGWVFAHAKLHRVQAAYLPENARSATLLQRLGFEIIGVAPRYLFINGAWRDHVLTQKISGAYPADQLEH
jgi:[ribosomal protein S5]-alanine N-acetyltransferase